MKSVTIWAFTAEGGPRVDTEVGTAAITLTALIFIC